MNKKLSFLLLIITMLSIVFISNINVKANSKYYSSIPKEFKGTWYSHVSRKNNPDVNVYYTTKYIFGKKRFYYYVLDPLSPKDQKLYATIKTEHPHNRFPKENSKTYFKEHSWVTAKTVKINGIKWLYIRNWLGDKKEGSLWRIKNNKLIIKDKINMNNYPTLYFYRTKPSKK